MLYVIVRGIRIWLPNAAKCCKNAGKIFPDVKLSYFILIAFFKYNTEYKDGYNRLY